MSSPLFSYPLLVCDIGGTNCRAAVAVGPDSDLQHLGSVTSDQFPAFEAAVAYFMRTHDITPASLIVCAAGPLQGRSVQLTNADWRIDGPAISENLNLQQGLLLNDFEALAYSLPVIPDGWTTPIIAGERQIGRPQIVLGPGTGLGMAGLVLVGGQHQALASEAGHGDFAALDETENAIWAHVRAQGMRVTPEAFLSGPGLARLHAARTGQAPHGVIQPQAITAAALADPQSEEAASLRHFWKLIARFSGDMALTLLAAGGVTLAGGILPRVAGLCDKQEFKSAFTAKQPMAHVVDTIPVRLLTQPGAVLHGMAAIAAHPENYAIDFEKRAWR